MPQCSTGARQAAGAFIDDDFRFGEESGPESSCGVVHIRLNHQRTAGKIKRRADARHLCFDRSSLSFDEDAHRLTDADLRRTALWNGRANRSGLVRTSVATGSPTLT